MMAPSNRELPAISCAKAALLLLGVCVPSAAILISMPKSGPGSVIRYAWIAVVPFIARRLLEQLSGATTSLVLNSVFIGQLCLVILQCCNFLVLTRLDAGDFMKANIYKSSDGLGRKLYGVVGLMFNLRGIGTPWQISRINASPQSLDKHIENGKLRKGPWVVRQLQVLFWQYLFLDFTYLSSLDTSPEDAEKLFGTGKEFLYINANGEQWGARVAVGLISWLAPARVTIDILYRVLSVVAVVSGMTSPEDWPPLFGSIWDSYTIRGFWSIFWHQHCRWFLTSVSNYLCRDLLRLPRPSRLERYFNIALVFMGSGLVHVMLDMFCWQPPLKAPTLAFFGSFAVAIMLEDGVQEVWRRISGAEDSKNVPLWHKIVGYIWVSTWLTVTSPWYLYHAVRQPVDVKWLVPFSVLNMMGPVAGNVLLFGGGLVLKYTIGGQI
ncbi:Acetyltransferase pyr8 [Colletotrichum gloeosporioides]|uniref:Acetyltransferase pyr8 n=1 Tax=Colletotrichum gloeosporioides TaxID=474922 RepID=A0A8H4FTK0_COLGL|nr:Acetyltransferase pyr8 [Colletotrichum gloeosporioides]KAF3811669.1 Acetyltransferase pyr8 [Colletotrichum gloeosporioides]